MGNTSQAKTRKRKTVKSSSNRKGKNASGNGDLSKSYDRYKTFDGKQYTGMKVGRSHKWYYDKGTWQETKITPDLWEISFNVIKRRAGKAPKGSGVPVGTGYHWYIVADQFVEKLNADDYTTRMSGFKYKLAHKRASKDQWNARTATQRKHLIDFFKRMITQLEAEPIPILFHYKDRDYEGEGIPVQETCGDGWCKEVAVSLNNEPVGIMRHLKSGWKMHGVEDKGLIKAIGKEINKWFDEE